MTIKRIFNTIWKDTVLSKVIAAGIIALIGTIWISLNSYLNDVSLLIKVGALIGIILVFLIILLIIGLLRKKRKSKLIIYLSTRGTCRDPMAKVITQKLLEKRQIDLRLDIRGMAVIDTSDLKISYGARHAIKSIYGEDLLSKHKCEKITKDYYDKADLILVMSNEVLKQLQLKFPNEKSNKVYLFKEFFGLQGDIKNPYPDGKDEDTLKRYTECANEFKEILTNNLDVLIEALIV